MLLAELAATSRDVAATPARREKVARLASALAAAAPGERPVAAAWLAGDLPQGRIGIGWGSAGAALQAAPPPPAEPSLTVGEVDAAFTAIATGRGAARTRALAELLARATREERDFLVRLTLGELRQGALEGLLADAVARAAGLPPPDIRRAIMLAGALSPVAAAVLAEGAAGLERFRLRVGDPIQPMLAQPAADLGEALETLGKAALEWKLDGARVQVHKDGDAVKVYSRTLRQVTAAVPEVASMVRGAPARTLVLDGEAIALRPDGSPEPFQVTMQRFGRKRDVDRLAAELPLTAFFFDVLHADGEDLLDRTNRERWETLARLLPSAHLVPRIVTADRAEAERFFEDALRRGHEGVVAKALEAPYEAGRRGAAWLKVKKVQTLDLVVLAAEWGSGRRRGFLSNLWLGARDPGGGGFAMLGKTFKGMTDEMLRWQTERLQALATRAQGHVVHVRPELVVEVAFDGIQASSTYPSGLALRFARVKRYREDKKAEDADAIATVRAAFSRRGAG